MCNFFSCVTMGDGILQYSNWKQRQRIIKGKLKIKSGQTVENADSHSEICAYYKLDCDKANKYEYNPLTKEFKVDQINNKRDDSKVVKAKFKKLEFKTIIEPLIIKKIVNPFEKKTHKIPLEKAIDLVKKWASVRDSVGASVWASVRDSVGASVWASVRDSVWASVRDSVGASVWASVGDSVGASVWASVWAYYSSFFNIKYKYDFSSCIKLWEDGYVPSYDGKTWRLHGYGGKILWEENHEKPA